MACCATEHMNKKAEELDLHAACNEATRTLPTTESTAVATETEQERRRKSRAKRRKRTERQSYRAIGWFQAANGERWAEKMASTEKHKKN